MTSLRTINRRNLRGVHAVRLNSGPQLLVERIGMRLIDFSMIVITAMSLANFNELILPQPLLPGLQQAVSFVLWLVVIYATFLVRPVTHISMPAGVVLLWALYGFAAVSVLWANYSASSILKGLTLLITTFGAYRLVLAVPVDRIILNIIHGLFIVVAVSLLTVLFAPKIGVVQLWMHHGKWKGIFESKQSLGTGSAILLFLALQRRMQGHNKRYCSIAALLAIVCVVGAGSRGGGVIAVSAFIISYLALRSPKLSHWLAFTPFVMTLVGAGIITFFVATGYRFIPLFGVELDLSSRTFIWQFSLSHFLEHPLLGFGLNGFWSQDQILSDFRHEYRWVLDNFHSGYVGIAMELGVIGYCLFAAGVWAWGQRIAETARTHGPSEHTALPVSLVNLLFFIDFTETFFLRSTNILAILLIALMFRSYAEPTGPSQSGAATGDL